MACGPDNFIKVPVTTDRKAEVFKVTLRDGDLEDAVAKSNVDEFLFCRKDGSSTLPKRLYPQR